VKVLQMLLSTIGQIPHLFLRHSSTTLRIRSIYSSSIKVTINSPLSLFFYLYFSTFLHQFPFSFSLFRWLHKTTLLALTKYTTLKFSTQPISLMLWLTFVLFFLVTISIIAYSFNQTFFLLFIHWFYWFTQRKLTRFG
jgi:hypothetical protein